MNARNKDKPKKSPVRFKGTSKEKAMGPCWHESALSNTPAHLTRSARQMPLVFEAYLKEQERRGACFFLQDPVSEIIIDNLGKFDVLRLEFSPGMNIIHESASSGRSTILEAIAIQFNLLSARILPYKEDRPTRIVRGHEPFAKRYARKREHTAHAYIDDPGCVLLDEPTDQMSPEYAKKFMAWLVDRFNGSQLIIATNSERRKDAIKRTCKEFRAIEVYATFNQKIETCQSNHRRTFIRDCFGREFNNALYSQNRQS